MGALDGKVAIVTGAGQGLGRAHAVTLAGHGAAVVVNDVSADSARAVVDDIAAAGGRAAANTASVSDWKATGNLVEQAVGTFGDLHVVVNNAWVLARELGRYGVTANVIAPRARTQMTENIPFFAAPEGGFDRYDPVHVSRVVAWLATDATAGINGQVLVVVGGDVHLVRPFEIVNTVHADDGWTVEGLAGAQAELFGDRPTEPPMTSVGA